MSNLINKAKAAVSSKKSHGSSGNDAQYDDPHSANTGPHSSSMMNKVDPRVDSDHDGRNDPTSRQGGYGNTHAEYSSADTGAGYGGATGGTYGSSTNEPGYNNPRSGNAGPHSSSILNKTDPRIDSDRDGRNDPTSRQGGYGNTQSEYSSAGAGTGAGGTHGSTNAPGYDNPKSVNAGPHSSKMMNQIDPRVDSDRDHRNDPTSRVGGYGDQQSGYSSGVVGSDGTTTGAAGYGSSATTGDANYGQHDSRLANQADPRIDSDRDGSRTVGHGSSANYGGGKEAQEYASAGTGKSTNAGPHNSNLLNKLDPRVDSDMSVGKTYGGNATHQ